MNFFCPVKPVLFLEGLFTSSRKISLVTLLFVSIIPTLYAAPAEFSLKKTSYTLQSATGNHALFQWVASNNTSIADNFFIYEMIPPGDSFDSIHPMNAGDSQIGMDHSLPLTGPATLVIGPFSIPANSAVSFLVSESLSSPKFRSKNLTGESFALVSQTQLSGKTDALAKNASALALTAGTPTAGHPTGLVLSLAAAPNISRHEEPILFNIELGEPARFTLSLFALTGEKIFSKQAEGTAGKNQISWDLLNNNASQVASGLYIYYLEVSGSSSEQTRTGKIAVIH